MDEKEAKQAIETAEAIRKKYLKGDGAKVADVAIGTGKGALTGLTVGAAIGTVFPGIGNAVGAAVGAIVGAISAAIVELLKLGPTPEQKRLAQVMTKLQHDVKAAIEKIPDIKAKRWIANALLAKLPKMPPSQYFAPFCISANPDVPVDLYWGGCANVDASGLEKMLVNLDAVVTQLVTEYAEKVRRERLKKLSIAFAVAAPVVTVSYLAWTSKLSSVARYIKRTVT